MYRAAIHETHIRRFAIMTLFSHRLPHLTMVPQGEGRLTFHTNGQFRILILADPQDTDKPQWAMLALMEASIREAKPDLVVLLGDVIHGPSLGEDRRATFAAIDAVMAPIVEAGCPFAVVFGNHDDEGGVSKEEQMNYYRRFPGCLATAGAPVTGCGNYNLLLHNRHGRPVYNLWFFDSGTYDRAGGGTYASVAADQIQWYREKSAALAAENGGTPLPAMAFQHIAVPEVYDLFLEVPKGTPGAVKGFGPRSRSYYVADPKAIRAGALRERPSPPDKNSGQFRAWLEMGDVRAAFFGHDHTNDYVGTCHGIDLVATPGASFYMYGAGGYHGSRVVTIYEKDLHYTTQVLHYRDIVDERLPRLFAATWGVYIQRAALWSLGGMALLAGGATALVHRRRKSRRALSAPALHH